MAVKMHIHVSRDQLDDYCRRNHIRKLSFFGSVVRDNFDSDSDVDVLVKFVPGHPVGFIRLAGMELELSEIIGRKVDMRTPADLIRYFRQGVLASALVQYEA